MGHRRGMGVRIAARHKFPPEQFGKEAERAHLPSEDISWMPEGREQSREVGTKHFFIQHLINLS